MIPNAIVVAFDNRVSFKVLKDTDLNSHCSRFGLLSIPIDEALPDDQKPGWIVDGQQRVAAIRDSKVDSFPVCVIGFISESERLQREQFILVNSAKPLAKALIYELLPSTHSVLPSFLERRRFPAALVARLNFDTDSPMRGLIRMHTCPDGIIKDNSVMKMIENSLNDGVLYRFRDPVTGEGDAEAMLSVLKSFWNAVADVFPVAWGLPPTRSRLMHGAGITSLGFLMDAIADRYRQQGLPSLDRFRCDLKPLKEICRWTDGYWHFGPGVQKKWNEIQNVSGDIQLLANYLLRQYKAIVWNRPINRETLVNET
jgi:DGQHR domain-containing protein